MQRNKEWISISDLMAGLMMVFLFIAIVFMLKIEKSTENLEKQNQTFKEIALTYEKSRKDLNAQLNDEFKYDLPKWGAELLDDNTVRFNEPEILFARGRIEINDQFKAILDDFFPRYLAILSSEKYREEIDEIRIEGHTSSIWRQTSTPEEAYLANARLSQGRSLSVLNYVYMLDDVSPKRDWLISVLRANGLSYAHRIFKANGVEDLARSRRVEFRVITKAEEKIYTILEKANETA